MMSGLNIMDNTFLISWFWLLSIDGTIAYGDFLFDYDKMKIRSSTQHLLPTTKKIIFYLISLACFFVPVYFNKKIKDFLPKFFVLNISASVF